MSNNSFYASDLLAQVWLSHAELVRGTAHMARFGNGQEESKMSHLQFDRSSSCSYRNHPIPMRATASCLMLCEHNFGESRFAQRTTYLLQS